MLCVVTAEEILRMFRPFITLIFLFVSLSASSADLSVLSWNTFLLPSYLKKSYHDERLPSLVEALKSSDQDIIMLQEVFTRKAYKKLYKALKPLGYYSTGKPFRSIYKPFNSGLIIFSKYPLTDIEIMLFDELAADDKFSSKGVLFAKANLPSGEVIQLATTHFQAKHSKKYQDIRKTHITQITQSFKKHIPSNIPVIFGGDFNIGEHILAERDNLMASFKKLGLSSIKPKGRLRYTSDCIGNSLKRYLRPDCDSRKQVDYIFFRTSISSGVKKMFKDTIGDLLVFDYVGDYMTDDGMKKLSLSDHLCVEAKISL